jgi:hypothetical protein
MRSAGWPRRARLSAPSHLPELAHTRHLSTHLARTVAAFPRVQIPKSELTPAVTATFSPLGLGLRSCQAQISLRTVGGSAKTGHLDLAFWKSQALKDH